MKNLEIPRKLGMTDTYMNKYKPVIGLEIHVELNTKTKMFCRCSADYFGKEPNTHTCPVCLGLPGALPYINEEAIKKCLMIGLALGCQVSEQSRFERKNYFYPDLSKGYQLSQYRWPLCKSGKIVIGDQEIRINRVHQEEDTGKLLHMANSIEHVVENSEPQPISHNPHATLVDFNRSGVPLVEIVTEPDFKTSEQVREYAKALQALFRYLGVSSADMERGDMRLEANISLREVKNQKSEVKSQELPNYRIELKNINSFSYMVKAIEYEIKRQTEELEKGTTLTQETRGWDDVKKVTYLQREKEEAHDYRYFPEPDLPELSVSVDQINQMKSEMPELPWEKVSRYVKDYGLSKEVAEVLVDKGAGFMEEFEWHIKEAQVKDVDPKQVASYLVNHPSAWDLSPQDLISEILQRKQNIVTDEGQIEVWAKEAIEENPKIVEDYQKGKTTAIMALVGAVMRKSQGKADPGKVQEILRRCLAPQDNSSVN